MGEKTCLWSELETKHRLGKLYTKNIKAKFIACDFAVKRVAAFGVVL